MTNETQTKQLLEKTYSCGNCALNHFSHDDKEEKQRCYGVGRFYELPMNHDLKFFIEKYDLKGICEYWQEIK